MVHIMQEVICWSIIILGFLGIMAGIMYSAMWLIGKIIKMCGWWNMFYKALMYIAKEQRKKRSNNDLTR